jgi:hypothetical protein
MLHGIATRSAHRMTRGGIESVVDQVNLALLAGEAADPVE